MYNSSSIHALRPLEIEMIRSEVNERNEMKKRLEKAGGGMLTVKTGDDWLEQERYKQPPRRLFGHFWYEHELCILFADTNMGKSILAVQLGNSLAKAKPIGTFELDMEQPQKVLYIDFELTAKQFEQRYTDTANRTYHRFGNHFFRAEFNPVTQRTADFRSDDHWVNSCIEDAVYKTSAKVLIIDNLTSLRSDTEKAADALPLMKHLKHLKTKFSLSILVLAHTPKRNPAKPITRNDLQGSKMLINFCDSAFAIGESQLEKDLRYLKQIKQRSTHEVYGADNVCTGRIIKQGSLLQYEFTGYATEQEHLGNRHHILARVAELNAQGLSQRQISAALNIAVGTVNKMLHQAVGGGK